MRTNMIISGYLFEFKNKLNKEGFYGKDQGCFRFW
jgi:hypothetical protein